MRSHKPQDTGGDAYAKPIPDILSQIKDSYRELRPAERRVADVVLADVTFSVDASNAEIARRADVSEPTVTRFCRAIGCEGVRDFKLKLAQSVVVGRLYLSPAPPSEPNGNGSPLWNVVFGEARNALSAVERSIDPADILKAAELVASAHQVLVFGLGGSSTALAQETQNRLFRYGVVVSAHSDPYVMKMTASTLKPNDLVIAISSTGRTREVVEAVELAKHYRAKAIAHHRARHRPCGGGRCRADRRRAGVSRSAEADRVALCLPRHHRPCIHCGRLPARTRCARDAAPDQVHGAEPP